MKATAPLNPYYTLMVVLGVFLLSPGSATATQMHHSSEGIIVHQLGHLFFLLSMAILIFTINGKELNREKGWRLLQYSAFLFILWNLDTICTHFLDNQIQAVQVVILDNWQMTLSTRNNSPILATVYYILKLDHLLCVPAIVLFYTGLRRILAAENNTRLPGSRQ